MPKFAKPTDQSNSPNPTRAPEAKLARLPSSSDNTVVLERLAAAIETQNSLLSMLIDAARSARQRDAAYEERMQQNAPQTPPQEPPAPTGEGEKHATGGKHKKEA